MVDISQRPGEQDIFSAVRDAEEIASRIIKSMQQDPFHTPETIGMVGCAIFVRAVVNAGYHPATRLLSATQQRERVQGRTRALRAALQMAADWLSSMAAQQDDGTCRYCKAEYGSCLHTDLNS